MKKTREFSGKDVDAAVRTACDTLSVSKKALKYEVISTGASGIFGIVGRKDAVIKVILPQNNAEPYKKDREGIRSRVDKPLGQDPRLPGPSEKKKTAPPAGESSVKEPPAPPRNKPAPPKKQAAEKPVESKPVPESAEERSAPEPSRPVSDDMPDDAAAAPDDSPDKAAAPEPPPPVAEVTQASIDLGLETLQRMADLITEGAKVEAETHRDHLTLKITGGNAGILIGRKGQTLDAMQFLTDKIINRQSEARVRVKVDVEGYIETRKSNLKHLAVKMAEKAKKTGKPATINQMSAQDRRIVHLTLKDDNRVRTQSMGDGYYRRLVIFPKKKNSFAGKKRFKR